MADLSRYIVRACFSQERMRYLPAKDTMDGKAKVIYSAKNGRTTQNFNAIPTLEADLTIDDTYSQLPLIDYGSQ